MKTNHHNYSDTPKSQISETNETQKEKENSTLKNRDSAVNFAMSIRGQMLIGKALYYGMIKIMEVEKEKQYYKGWVKELEDLKIIKDLSIKQKSRFKSLEDLLKDYKISDVEDLEYISETLYQPWIEMAKFTEQFKEGDLLKLLDKKI